jgi:ribosomal protein L5
LEKIVLSRGVGQLFLIKIIDYAVDELTRSLDKSLYLQFQRKDVASEKEMPIGAKVTLRGKNMSFR